MAYQSKSAKLLNSPYRFTHRIKATESKRVDYPNGMSGSVQVETWNRPAALYSTNMTSVASIEIYNAKYDIMFAVRKINDDPLDKLNFDTTKIFHLDDDKDTKYTIKNIQRATEPNGYHVITLTTNADSSTTTSSSGSGYGSYGY
ncbi:hypothetical protein QUE93_10815 [Leuconostoc falkenbergense]|uniref:Uncharacterized protein n=1 Tax=Leuconostoc falkenbergense TaxID=2766470 RepID=A0ABT7S1N9_9LACO|nr:hypothetical protein [Leuconostoc falkenbergense]MDM7647498.1 hypothetical protein [Leuconostoc falkenbergense]